MPKPKSKLHSCAYCGAKTDRDLHCPRCGRDGCSECMPCGRGCICPECEESLNDED